VSFFTNSHVCPPLFPPTLILENCMWYLELSSSRLISFLWRGYPAMTRVPFLIWSQDESLFSNSQSLSSCRRRWMFSSNLALRPFLSPIPVKHAPSLRTRVHETILLDTQDPPIRLIPSDARPHQSLEFLAFSAPFPPFLIVVGKTASTFSQRPFSFFSFFPGAKPSPLFRVSLLTEAFFFQGLSALFFFKSKSCPYTRQHLAPFISLVMTGCEFLRGRLPVTCEMVFIG